MDTESQKRIAVIFILLFACCKLRCKFLRNLLCKLREIVQYLNNFTLDWQRWNGHRDLFQLLRGQVYNLCSFRYALLLGKEVIRLEPICNILRVLIVPKNSCMSTCHNLLITKPDNTLAYIFYIFARNSNNQIAFVYFLQFFSQFMGYK